MSEILKDCAENGHENDTWLPKHSDNGNQCVIGTNISQGWTYQIAKCWDTEKKCVWEEFEEFLPRFNIVVRAILFADYILGDPDEDAEEFCNEHDDRLHVRVIELDRIAALARRQLLTIHLFRDESHNNAW